MRSLICVLCVFVVATAGCSSPTEPQEPAVVTLAPGGSTTYGSLRVTFDRVTSDTRCPGDALCIQAGDAKVAIEIYRLGLRRSAELALVEPSKRSITHTGYTITFDVLNPYPFFSQGPIPPAAYRARFTIAKQ